MAGVFVFRRTGAARRVASLMMMVLFLSVSLLVARRPKVVPSNFDKAQPFPTLFSAARMLIVTLIMGCAFWMHEPGSDDG